MRFIRGSSFLLLLFPAFSPAQSSSVIASPIVGYVTDEAHLPIAYAAVQSTCASSVVSTSTNTLGEFRLSCASSLGPIRIEAAGFAPQTINLTSAFRSPVVLRPVTAGETVSVTATRSSSPLGQIAKTIVTLDTNQLHDFPAATLDESLRQHAGFELFRRAPNRVANPTSEGVSLRGLGSTAASRTLVLEDGVPLNDPFGGYIHWNETPQQSVESVTFVSGGGSDLYGSSALGGVIDVVPASPSSTYFNLSLAGGAQDTSHLEGIASRAGHALGLLFAGEALRTAGYRLPDPVLAGLVDTPANVRSQAYRIELGRRDFATRRLFATGNLLNEDRSNGTPLQTNATRLWRYLAGYALPQTNHATGRIRVFGSSEGYRQSFSAVRPNRNSEFLTRLQRVHTQELGATSDTTLNLGPLVGVAGVDLRDLRATDKETPISRGAISGLQDVTARQRFLGGFGELLAEHHGWSAAASIRADRASNLDTIQSNLTGATASRLSPPDRTEIALSPRIGLARTLGQHTTVHASGFRAFRSPTFNELYRTGQVGQEITLANSNLLSERATGGEFGAQFSTLSQNTSFQATYFWTEINRPVSAIVFSRTSTTITNQRVNLGQLRSRGVELALAWHPLRPITTTVGYQFADATVTRFAPQPDLIGNRLPQVPRNSFTSQIHANHQRLGELTLALRASGRVFDDSNNNFLLNGFVAVDLSGQRDISRDVSLFFLIQNLTDRRPQVARTPILTLGSPTFAEAGLRIHLAKRAK